MAATTGLGQSSRAASIGVRNSVSRFWPEVILPNSRMSAPAMKVRPAPISTTALTDSSSRADFRQATTPSGTPGLRALTGGLSIVTTATSPSRLRVTSSLMSVTPSVVLSRLVQLLLQHLLDHVGAHRAFHLAHDRALDRVRGSSFAILVICDRLRV